MSANASRPKKAGIVFRLAVSDLLHERVLTLCIVLALAAIISPLLIVLGLKEGIVEHLRSDLVEDPVNREIRPKTTQNLPTGWFETMKAREEVEFIVPGILRGASIVRIARTDDRRNRQTVDLLPTGDGDPLLLENGARIPSDDEIVVSQPLADKLKLKVGDDVVVQVVRTYQGQPEVATVDLKIAAVLGIRGDDLPRIYAPLQFVVDVESYKEGGSVPERGWDGRRAVPYESYDGVLILSEERLDGIKVRALTVGTGFSRIDEFGPDRLSDLLGMELAGDYRVYDLHTSRRPVQSSSVGQVVDQLRGQEVLIIPYALPQTILFADGRELSVFGYNMSEEQGARFGLPDVPWASMSSMASFRSQSQIFVPQDFGHDPAAGTKVEVVRMAVHGGEISFPMEITGVAPGTRALVPLTLATMLRTGSERLLVYSAEDESLLLARAGYRGFRIYARTIDDVPALVKDLEANGIDVLAKVQEIEGLKSFSAGLDRVFFLVAAVGLIGGIAALLASLYAAVERKRREIGVMRLLGLSPRHVFAFPIYQGLMIALLSVGVAYAAFLITGEVINRAFSSELDGDPAVFLALSIVLTVFTIGIVAAFGSSLASANRAVRIDPAEAIRVE